MKKQIVVLILLCFSTIVNAQDLKVMTYNIRYDNAGDSINQWKNRKDKMKALLLKYNPSIIGFQEVLKNQLDDIQNMLPYFSYAGVGRDDGKEKGEYAPVFFDAKRFKLIKSGTFWLSTSPDVAGSVGWDAALTRICTWVELSDRENGKHLFAFNTHFDHQGVNARTMSAKLIVEKMKKIAGDAPVVLTGDFNSEPAEEAYKTIVSSESGAMKDCYTPNADEPDCTFKGFVVNSNICKRIDYIFCSRNFENNFCKILDDNDGSFYPSDHLAVIATLKLK